MNNLRIDNLFDFISQDISHKFFTIASEFWTIFYLKSSIVLLYQCPEKRIIFGLFGAKDRNSLCSHESSVIIVVVVLVISVSINCSRAYG